MPAAPPPTTPKPAGSPHPILFVLQRPEFTDGSLGVDPIESAKVEIEAMVARGDCVSAVRNVLSFANSILARCCQQWRWGSLPKDWSKNKDAKPAVSLVNCLRCHLV